MIWFCCEIIKYKMFTSISRSASEFYKPLKRNLPIYFTLLIMQKASIYWGLAALPRAHCFNYCGATSHVVRHKFNFLFLKVKDNMYVLIRALLRKQPSSRLNCTFLSLFYLHANGLMKCCL